MSIVTSVHLRIVRCHQINRCHIWLLLVKVFAELKKVLSLKWKNPPYEAFNWWEGWKAESWVTQLILRLQDLWQSVSQSVQSLSHVRLFATPWTAVCQASLSITNSQSLLKFMSIESMMPSNHLILCRPLLVPSTFPNIRVFFNLSQHQGIFQWASSSHQVARVLEFQLQHQSFQWILRTDFL